MEEAREDNLLPLKWRALEFEYFEKSPEWFWSVIIISFAVFAASLVLNNFLFGVLMLISGITIALYGLKKPQTIDIALTPRGLEIQDKFYPYNEMESFWVHYDPPYTKNLSIYLKKTFAMPLKIPLEDFDPNDIREVLIKFVKEKEHIENFTDNLIRILKF